MVRFLQANINHSWPAHHLLAQQRLEKGIGICVISEPVRIPDSGLWMASRDRRAAVTWDPDRTTHPCHLAVRGQNFVAARFKDIYIVSCYVSPNAGACDLLAFLDELGDALQDFGRRRVIICGDFNCKSSAWGSSTTNRKGQILAEWMAEQNVILVNVGSVPTCVRPQGTSIVDLTWATQDLIGRIRDWHVLQGENMSDHNYIQFCLEESMPSLLSPPLGRRRGSTIPRWNAKRFDAEMFAAALEWSCENDTADDQTANGLREWLDRVVRDAHDMAAPRAQKRGPRRQVYWWSDRIAELRKAANQARRKATRANSRGRLAEAARLKEEYKARKKELKAGIRRAMTEAFQELIATIEGDPWGLPYKLVLARLKQATPPLTELLEEEDLEAALNLLFPGNRDRSGNANEDPTYMDIHWWEDQLRVRPDEVFAAIKGRKINRSTAPGLDGVRACVWKQIPNAMVEQITACFQACFREGVFPEAWKRAKLVLIPKGKGADLGPSQVRPICLLNDIGKALERIIAGRIEQWMSEHEFTQPSVSQYGFRRNRSTIDALASVKRTITEAVSDGGVAIAIGVDIKNAFNSLPWEMIRRALKRKGFPSYIRRMIDDYLSCRRVEFPVAGGRWKTREVYAGVPQGSVLGPLLWTLTYDYVLEGRLHEGCSVTCYADDTLILATAEDAATAVTRANIQASTVTRRIKDLGLQVSIQKTEACIFHGKRRHMDLQNLYVTVERDLVPVARSLKYLGVHLDSRLTFADHLAHVEEKASAMARALSRLMPNLRGPSEVKRRLYAKTVESATLYGAPVWSDALAISRVGLRRLEKLQRAVAIRVISAYRTASTDAVLLLARTPPYALVAATQKRTYDRLQDLKRRGQWTREQENEVKQEENRLLRRRWKTHLQRPGAAGVWTRNAILPSFDEWLDRTHGRLTFRMTQILTGHGCFNEYLNRIGKARYPYCSHCNGGRDTVDHTVQDCTAWTSAREELRRVVGYDLYLDQIVKAATRSSEAWKAFAAFAEKVMSEKEMAERERQRRGRSESSSQ